MGVNTRVLDGIIYNLGVDVKLMRATNKAIDYNPGLARDDKGNLWISIRSCSFPKHPKEHNGLIHPMHYQNYLYIGMLDEKTLEISGVKEVKPEAEYEGFQWGIEDIRLFWRKDGMHGVGVILPVDKSEGYKLRQAEILIDYKKGTYKLLKDLGRPFGHVEKNWSPSETENQWFDYIYSPTQIVKDGEVIGEPNDLFIHNGTPLIPYEDGWLSLGHAVASVNGERTYANLALKWSEQGALVAHTPFFHFNVGWREGLQETIEFASGMVWSKGKEGQEVVVGVGVKDELIGLCRIPVDKFKFIDYVDTVWYAWRFDGELNRTELFV